MSIENSMVVGLGEALERHYAAEDSTVRDFAELQVLGDTLEFFEFVDCRDGLADAADRALRMVSRLFDADNATLFAAALLSAHRGNAADTMLTLSMLTRRYLRAQDARIERIARGDK